MRERAKILGCHVVRKRNGKCVCATPLGAVLIAHGDNLIAGNAWLDIPGVGSLRLGVSTKRETAIREVDALLRTIVRLADGCFGEPFRRRARRLRGAK